MRLCCWVAAVFWVGYVQCTGWARDSRTAKPHKCTQVVCVAKRPFYAGWRELRRADQCGIDKPIEPGARLQAGDPSIRESTLERLKKKRGAAP